MYKIIIALVCLLSNHCFAQKTFKGITIGEKMEINKSINFNDINGDISSNTLEDGTCWAISFISDMRANLSRSQIESFIEKIETQLKINLVREKNSMGWYEYYKTTVDGYTYSVRYRLDVHELEFSLKNDSLQQVWQSELGD
jgi:uncharacterized protein YpbB